MTNQSAFALQVTFSHTHTQTQTQHILVYTELFFFPLSHIHTPIDVSVGKVGFSALPKDNSTCGLWKLEPSDWHLSYSFPTLSAVYNHLSLEMLFRGVLCYVDLCFLLLNGVHKPRFKQDSYMLIQSHLIKLINKAESGEGECQSMWCYGQH